LTVGTPWELPGLAKLMLDVNSVKRAGRWPSSHLGCIGDPSKITDTPDGAPAIPSKRSPTHRWCTS